MCLITILFINVKITGLCMTEVKYPVTIKDLLNLEKGEVVKYDSGSGTQYLIVDRIDTVTGQISGQITEAPGVNSISLDDLVEWSVDISKCRNPKT